MPPTVQQVEAGEPHTVFSVTKVPQHEITIPVWCTMLVVLHMHKGNRKPSGQDKGKQYLWLLG